MRLIFFIMLATSILRAETLEPRFSMTYNIGETAAFTLANKLFIKKPKLIYLPLHFDANLKLKDWLALSMALVYRYEDYQAPLSSSTTELRPTQIWTKYNEIFVLAGPRFSPLKTGIEGFYVSTRAGLGVAFSPKYWNLSLLMQPEIGYTFAFTNPGFNLNLGLGMLFNLPFYEKLDFAVPWSKNYKSINALQIIVHNAIPIINIGIGFNI
jgi:hypothetical protein